MDGGAPMSVFIVGDEAPWTIVCYPEFNGYSSECDIWTIARSVVSASTLVNWLN